MIKTLFFSDWKTEVKNSGTVFSIKVGLMYHYSFFFNFIYFICDAGDLTNGLVHTKPVLYTELFPQPQWVSILGIWHLYYEELLIIT
jgi:hypothetical protein